MLLIDLLTARGGKLLSILNHDTCFDMYKKLKEGKEYPIYSDMAKDKFIKGIRLKSHNNYAKNLLEEIEKEGYMGISDTSLTVAKYLLSDVDIKKGVTEKALIANDKEVVRR